MPTHPSCWPPVGPSLARVSLLAFALVAAACQTCGGEQTEVPTPSEPVPERLTLVTLNVATPVRAEARTNALLAAQPTVSRRRSRSSPRTTSAFGSSSLADQSSTPTPNTTPGARPVA